MEENKKCTVLGCKRKAKYIATFAETWHICYCPVHEYLFDLVFTKDLLKRKKFKR